MRPVYWSRHAKERFAEKAVKYGVNYGDIELELVKQKVRLKEPGQDKFKTVFRVREVFLTAVKLDGQNFIHVITLWESNENEVKRWQQKME